MSEAIQWISVCKRKGAELTSSLQRNIKLVLREDFIIVHAYEENISNISNYDCNFSNFKKIAHLCWIT